MLSPFWIEYGPVIAFYIIVIALIYFNRKRFDFQGKIIALYRNNWGVEWMNKTGKKYSETIKALGNVGIYVGYLGMIGIIVLVARGIWNLVAVPSAPATFAPVLPGVPIPGTGITVPLLEGLIALFFVVVVHEAAHGLVAAAHKMKVKSSGLVLFGPLPGAFVEPDEKQLKKAPVKTQLAIYAAGPWSNVIQAIIFFGLFILVAGLTAGVAGPVGFQVEQVVDESPAMLAGFPEGVTISAIEGERIYTANDLLLFLENKTPGDALTFTADQDYVVTLGEHPQDKDTPWIGINGIETVFALEQNHPLVFWFLKFVLNIIQWTYILALGLGLANLLPLGPVDGGRMFHHALRKFLPEKKADALWAQSAIILLVIIVILLLVPIIRGLL